MSWILTSDTLSPEHRTLIGGKGYALAMLKQHGFAVPRTACLTATAYQHFVDRTGLRERIMLELNRKPLRHMRWEELWDAALRIRNLFLTRPLPTALQTELQGLLKNDFYKVSVTVRSSAADEDAQRTSFAGLHASVVNVRGTAAVIERIKRVWASLWSDAALLYRQELGLDPAQSVMAVLIQETVIGDRSGVAFSVNPNDGNQALVEAVHGLNQGLVDGQIEPDRWVLDRASKKIRAHHSARRMHWMVADAQEVRRGELPPQRRDTAPLNEEEVRAVLDLALGIEQLFESPQDVEWTIRNDKLIVLQARPITTLAAQGKDDQRGWYLSLHRSHENLKKLRQTIKKEHLPAMAADARQLASLDLAGLSNMDLAREIRRREEINTHWVNVYWKDFIPFAHGMRLFGQVYNDQLHPQDPYEFMGLLGQAPMLSIERNQLLEKMTDMVRADPLLAEHLKADQMDELNPDFAALLDTFVQHYGDLSCPATGGSGCGTVPDTLKLYLLKAAEEKLRRVRSHNARNIAQMKQRFLESFPEQKKPEAADLLDLARASYRLRDDDNIYLGRIEAQLLAARQEGQRRLASRPDPTDQALGMAELQAALETLPARAEKKQAPGVEQPAAFRLQARQLLGQPAGPGLVRAPARVILKHTDLRSFDHGEILVCDAIDPNMTFIVPLATGIVERRGGMLIHGAIIAREYGLPCVTGVQDATVRIKTGDAITVDGYLGIVTIGT